MSAAVTRTKELEKGTTDFAQSDDEVAKGKCDRGLISEHGMTPLMRAASDGLAGTVQALIDRGAEVNARRSDGFNALALAAFFGNSQVAWLLLENGADLGATGRCQTSPERWADSRGFFEIGDVLREARAAAAVKVSTINSAVIDETARFSRPDESEKSADPSSHVEPAVIDEVASFSSPDASENLADASYADVPALIDEIASFSRSNESETLADPTPAVKPELIDKVASFTRPDESETLAGLSPAELPAIDEATNCEPWLEMQPEQLADESTARRSSAKVEFLIGDTSGWQQEELVNDQSSRLLKMLPEIEDPPPMAVPKFHPGIAFVTRVTSSPKTLVTLLVAVLAIGCGLAALLSPSVRKSLYSQPTSSVAQTTAPSVTTSQLAGSGTNTSGTGPTSAPPAQASTDETAAKDIEITPANSIDNKQVDTSRNESTEESEKGSSYSAAANESKSRSQASSDSSVPSASDDKPDSVNTPLTRAGVRNRKQRAVSRVEKFKPQTASEEQPKPAPLSVETSRSRSVVSTPAERANDVPRIQSPPSSVISTKPKSKVIQWP